MSTSERGVSSGDSIELEIPDEEAELPSRLRSLTHKLWSSVTKIGHIIVAEAALHFPSLDGHKIHQLLLSQQAAIGQLSQEGFTDDDVRKHLRDALDDAASLSNRGLSPAALRRLRKYRARFRTLRKNSDKARELANWLLQKKQWRLTLQTVGKGLLIVALLTAARATRRLSEEKQATSREASSDDARQDGGERCARLLEAHREELEREEKQSFASDAEVRRAYNAANSKKLRQFGEFHRCLRESNQEVTPEHAKYYSEERRKSQKRFRRHTSLFGNAGILLRELFYPPPTYEGLAAKGNTPLDIIYKSFKTGGQDMGLERNDVNERLELWDVLKKAGVRHIFPEDMTEEMLTMFRKGPSQIDALLKKLS